VTDEHKEHHMTTSAPNTAVSYPSPSVVAQPTIRATAVSKRYGNTHALNGIDLEVLSGEILGLVGHNGAGKSTLMRLLAGRERPDTGTVGFCDAPAGSPWTGPVAEAAGVRMVYQELALCPDLSVTENAWLSDRRTSGGFGWRRRAERRIIDVLDTVFPGHGIAVVKRAGDLPMAQRQMVEIARALCTERLRLLILDEPTESLGVDAADQLYAHLRTLTERGVSVLLISHRMQEVIAHSDRIAVMKDGRVISVSDASVTEGELLVTMGGEVRPDAATLDRVVSAESVGPSADSSMREGALVAAVASTSGKAFEACAGEIIGLAGLAGQGQEELLQKLWAPGPFSRGTQVPRHRAYVPGDRQSSGILPLWSVAENLTIAASRVISRCGFVNVRRKRELADHWVNALKVLGGAHSPITALSGGNQQKVLIARAFAAEAELVLLDDPFRGVDVATKNELYALMKAEASLGRCIVWYSTENKEMAHCDRVYVFRAGRIVSELTGSTITEERIIADSFDDRTGETR
jgi:ribose transport system ATP-binding protein